MTALEWIVAGFIIWCAWMAVRRALALVKREDEARDRQRDAERAARRRASREDALRRMRRRD
jgi:threonine/homoserine/homoserine lactone efflux protein